ncbi:DUF3987 domain-containing protein [Xanthobacter agilis]|uniref:DUF3987 domain-containing protein n=1 Tax=Xanthobacter agilis TaxID=47492 RepID=UPI00372733FE
MNTTNIIEPPGSIKPHVAPTPGAAILEAALAYARAGFRIFPVRQDKVPLVKVWAQTATTDETKIREWWAKWPTAIIGLPTGAVNGLWALDLDVDPDKGADGNAALAALEATHSTVDVDVVATTPRGGSHLFFRWDASRPVRNTISLIARGIDTRGEGGFVVLAPSARDDGRGYAWVNNPLGEADLTDAPDWLLDLIDKPPPPPAQAESAPSAPQPAADDPLFPLKRAYTVAALEREVEAVATAQEGGRNARLNEAAHAIGNYVGSGHLTEAEVHTALTAAALTVGLDAKETRKTIASGIRAGRTKEPRWPPEWEAELAEVERLKALNAGLIATTAPAPAIDRMWDAPNMAPLGGDRRPIPQFNVEWFGPHLGRWADAQARATCAPADYVACALLALVGGLLGNRRRPLAGAGWEEPPLLWMALVGDPSSGKSPASSAVMALVNAEEARLDSDYRGRRREYEAQKVKADAVLAAHKTAWKEQMRGSPEIAEILPPTLPEGFVEPVKPILRRIVVRDSTVERLATLSAENPTGLLLHRDELSGLFASFGRYSGGGGADRQFFLECYGGRAFTVDRVKTGEPVRVPHLSISIVGALQPDKAAELLGGADDGFTGRFLWCWPAPVPGFRIAREALDRSPAERVVNRLHGLHMISNPPPEPDSPAHVPVEEAALVLLERFALEMKGREKGAMPLIKSAIGKARGHALRLSSILTFLWWAADPRASWSEPAEIGEAAMATAIEMMTNYFVPMAERVFDDASVPVVETNAAILARHLREKGLKTFNASKLRTIIGGPLRDSVAMDAACVELEDAGLIQAVEVVKKRGRPSKNFTVNSRLFE